MRKGNWEERQMKVVLSLIIAFLIAEVSAGVAFAQSAQTPSSTAAVASPSRTVKGRVLTSKEMPPVHLNFSKLFKYVGTQSFILYDVASAEQHFFVDADQQGRIRRMYWVQFEGYLPNNTHTYRYKVNKI